MTRLRLSSRSRLLPLALVAIAGLAGACAGSGSPLAPSATAAASTSGVTIAGQVAGSSTAERAQSTASGLTVTVAGTNLSTTVQSNGQFTLQNVPAGDVSLQFTGPGTNAMLTLSGLTNGQQVHITVSVSGSTASVESEQDTTPGSSEIQLEGLISSMDLTAQTMVVNGTTVSVPTTATIRHGSTSVSFASLQVGQRVHVQGSMQGSTLVASEVLLQNENVSNEPPSGNTEKPTEVSGTLAAAPTGTCPAVTFTVNGTVVVTSSSTSFNGGACSDLAAGSQVEVKGTTGSTGLTATEVSIEQPESSTSETEVKGTLAAAPAGTCPTISFTVGTTAVSTTSATSFENGACTDVTTGTSVDVTGTLTGTSLVATSVSIEDSHGNGKGKG